MSSVTISIVSYGQEALLDRCLTQIRALRLPSEWRVIVVDNHSTDHSADMVAAKHAWVELVALDENLGFGGGHNLAYARSSADSFIILNPDVIVLPGSLEKLLAALEQFPQAAIVGPCLLNPDGSLQYSARRFYTWYTVLCRRLPIPGRQEINDRHLMKDVDMTKPYRADWILGAVMAVRRSAFGRKELFDRRYRLYLEDVDLCYFARRDGWDVLCYPESRMIHDHQRSSARSLISKANLWHLSSWIKFCTKCWAARGNCDPHRAKERKTRPDLT